MTATPIPRTLTMTIYGDMDISIIREKPKTRKSIKTYSKLENKIDDVIKFVKREISFGNQIFWVCPLIDESKLLDYSSAKNKFDLIKTESYSKNLQLYYKEGVRWMKKKYGFDNKWLLQNFKL